MTDNYEGSCSGGEKGTHGGARRADPFAEVWEPEIVPRLGASPDIRAVDLFRELQRLHPCEFDESVRRTFERRVRDWKTANGADREVYFPQVPEPGEMAQSDFTDMRSLGVTVMGVLLVHILYHFRLVYSGFEYACVILFGESFPALSSGLQNALRLAGGSPRTHRTDSLSSAFRNIAEVDEEDLTRRYEVLCSDYCMKPTRNNRGRAHENGSIESSHGHLKRAVGGGLELRGSRDFESVDAYGVFLDGIVNQRNSRPGVVRKLAEERKFLRPLPAMRSIDYEDVSVKVRKSCGFSLRKVFYTVPSRLIGRLLHVRLYDDRLEVFDGSTHLLTLVRGRPRGNRRGHVIDYRHVIHSLKNKPMALLRLTYRDELFPCRAYRRTFELALEKLDERKACRLGVGLLALAHEQCCERRLAAELNRLLGEGRLPDLNVLRLQFQPKDGELPEVEIRLPSLEDYEQLIGCDSEDAGEAEDGS